MWTAVTRADNTRCRDGASCDRDIAPAVINSHTREGSEIDFNPAAELAKRVFERKNPLMLLLIHDPVQLK